MVVVAAIEMRIQAVNEACVASAVARQRRYVVYHIKRVCPLIALRPPRVRTRPPAVGVPRLHKSGCIIEQHEWRGHRTVVEHGYDLGWLPQRIRQTIQSVIIVCGIVRLSTTRRRNGTRKRSRACGTLTPSARRQRPSLYLHTLTRVLRVLHIPHSGVR